MSLKSCYLFQGLSEDQEDRLAEAIEEIRFRGGDRIFAEGQEAMNFYVLLEGTVVLFMEVEGVEFPIRVLRIPGECFGTAALLMPNAYNISARSETDSMVLSVLRERLENIASRDRELGLILMKNIARHLMERLNESRQELKAHFKSLLRLSQFIH